MEFLERFIANPFTFEGLILWLGALATLALYTVLYRENPIYRFAEHVFLGLATGFGLYIIWRDVLYPDWFRELAEGRWAWMLALVAGAMYYTIYSKRFAWMSRLVMLTMMGLAAGLAFRQWSGRYMQQIGASFKPIVVVDPQLTTGEAVFDSLTNILFMVTMIAVMTYFFFSFEQKSKGVQRTAKLGRWLMMIAFGAMFGSTVMARLSLFIGRLMYLFQEWIHLIGA